MRASSKERERRSKLLGSEFFFDPEKGEKGDKRETST